MATGNINFSSQIYVKLLNDYSKYSETSIRRFRRGSEKETMNLGKQ
jgi:hypothetical protein